MDEYKTFLSRDDFITRELGAARPRTVVEWPIRWRRQARQEAITDLTAHFDDELPPLYMTKLLQKQHLNNEERYKVIMFLYGNGFDPKSIYKFFCGLSYNEKDLYHVAYILQRIFNRTYDHYRFFSMISKRLIRLAEMGSPPDSIPRPVVPPVAVPVRALPAPPPPVVVEETKDDIPVFITPDEVDLLRNLREQERYKRQFILRAQRSARYALRNKRKRSLLNRQTALNKRLYPKFRGLFKYI